MKKLLARAAFAAALFVSATAAVRAQVPAQLQPGDRVAVCGDSITEAKQYSVFVEEYLLAVQPRPGVRAMQFGWGGESAGGFLNRLKNDVLPFAPTVVTTCYGMNDGRYTALRPDVADLYRKATTDIVRALKEGGVRTIIVGTPGVVDTEKFNRNNTSAATYNETLRGLGEIGREVAAAEGVAFADVHGAMLAAMTKFKAAHPGVAFAGSDGFHPGPNGHLAMAYAFLKALGCDGDVGTITIDAAAGKATATDGHKVLTAAAAGGAGSVEATVESSRYPFVAAGKVDDPNTARGTLPYLPFNQDLNRFRLVVTGVSGKAKVTWGEASKEFDSQALAAGINLAAEFPDNPFGPAFAKLTAAVREQQNFETPGIKQIISPSANYRKLLPDDTAAVDALVTAVRTRAAKLNDAAAATVTPVTHTIRVEPVR